MNTFSRYILSSPVRTAYLNSSSLLSQMGSCSVPHTHEQRSANAGILHTARNNEVSMRSFSTFYTSVMRQQQGNEEGQTEKETGTENEEQQEQQQGNEKDAKIEELENRVKELEKKYLMSLAETENTRRIAKVDIEKAKKYSLSNYTKSLLEVADNLERAMTVIDADQLNTEFQEEKPRKKVSTLLQGIRMTHNILQRVFKNHGIEKIPNPLGEKFDPKFHDAISQQPDPSQTTGTVSYVISEGYMINDRVLRATSVAVVVNEDEDLPSFDESECLTTEKPGEESGETEKEAVVEEEQKKE